MTLSEEERNEIEQLLLELKSELEERMKPLTESSQPVSLEDPIGRLSRIDAIQGQQMALAGLSREQQRLERVRHALRCVALPDFGLCTGCKQPIGIDRLRFQPDVLLCVRCALTRR